MKIIVCAGCFIVICPLEQDCYYLSKDLKSLGNGLPFACTKINNHEFCNFMPVGYYDGQGAVTMDEIYFTGSYLKALLFEKLRNLNK